MQRLSRIIDRYMTAYIRPGHFYFFTKGWKPMAPRGRRG
jgi:hypothetical protein